MTLYPLQLVLSVCLTLVSVLRYHSDGARISSRHNRIIWLVRVSSATRFDGITGVIINAYACIFLLVIVIFNFFPPSTPTTSDTINMSVLVLGVAILFAVIRVRWRKAYNEPVLE